jgi:hypothetical protein
MSTEGYEFTDKENRTFLELGDRMRFVGKSMLLLGVLFLIAAGVACFRTDELGNSIAVFTTAGSIITLASLVQSGTLFFIGIFTIRGAGHIGCIATTEGADINHLMAAMNHMSDLYGLIRSLARLAVATALIAVAGIGYGLLTGF